MSESTARKPRTRYGTATALGVVLAAATAWKFGAVGSEASAPVHQAPPVASNLPPAPPASAPSPKRNVLSDEVWKVPVYPDDPVKGPADALVTIVAFSEFEAAFCKRAAATLDDVLRAYPTDVRVIWKDNPLPFNAHAKPAALFARHVYAQKGNDGFWQAHDQLFSSQPKLAHEDLCAVAGTLGVTWHGDAERENRPYSAKLDQSIILGGDVQVRGTPHFFINGRRLAGSQPLDTFKRAVDEALAHANTLITRGVSRSEIYEATIAKGREPPPLVVKNVPAPDASTPVRGDANATIVIQMFAEFPCAPCARSAQTIEDIENEYRGQVSVARRFLPATDKPEATLAAEVALEVYAERGEAAFRTFHERVLDAAGQGNPLDQATLLRIAVGTSASENRVKQALVTRKHKNRVLGDAELASRAGIARSPSFVVNGYYLDGEARGPAFKKVILRSVAGR